MLLSVFMLISANLLTMSITHFCWMSFWEFGCTSTLCPQETFKMAMQWLECKWNLFFLVINWVLFFVQNVYLLHVFWQQNVKTFNGVRFRTFGSIFKALYNTQVMFSIWKIFRLHDQSQAERLVTYSPFIRSSTTLASSSTTSLFPSFARAWEAQERM